MFGDQFYWGGRIADLALGATIPFSGMTDESATGALRAVLDEVLDPAAAVRARAFAAQLRADGAAVAARRLEAEYGAGR